MRRAGRQAAGHHEIKARRALGLCAALAALLLPLPWWPSAGAAGPTVAVALFYAPTPLTTYAGLVPEEYASADLSERLAAAAAGRFAVVPRDRVRVQEAGLRWRESDVLRFARLGELAHAAGADRVAVGWIQVLALDRLGGGGGNDLDIGGGEGGGPLDGLAVVTVQIFDASQGRIVYQTQVAGHATGGPASRVIQATLDDAVRRGAAQLLGPLAAGPGAP
jgi:hypothetical protein